MVCWRESNCLCLFSERIFGSIFLLFYPIVTCSPRLFSLSILRLKIQKLHQKNLTKNPLTLYCLYKIIFQSAAWTLIQVNMWQMCLQGFSLFIIPLTHQNVSQAPSTQTVPNRRMFWQWKETTRASVIRLRHRWLWHWKSIIIIFKSTPVLLFVDFSFKKKKSNLLQTSKNITAAVRYKRSWVWRFHQTRKLLKYIKFDVWLTWNESMQVLFWNVVHQKR